MRLNDRNPDTSCQHCIYAMDHDDDGKMDHCHFNPPGLTEGPIVIKDPLNVPTEIFLDPFSVIPMGPKGDLYRLIVSGFPSVMVDDRCGQWRGEDEL